ncbi:MAG: hypothetical protein PHS44_00475 [Candidatus Dojkabacteria bacterium]|jgi:hypothetical protein|nr:hypothetical protein [Candidatus Dojkabacteria bacterium]
METAGKVTREQLQAFTESYNGVFYHNENKAELPDGTRLKLLTRGRVGYLKL